MIRRFVVGIDEAGRGPLAGPVAIGAILMEESAYRRLAARLTKEGIRDSKKLTAAKREALYEWIKQEAIKGTLFYSCALVASRVIDAKGISHAIRLGISKNLLKLGADPRACRILLDGGLKAPPVYVRQKTIIKGDEKEPIIALASIVAKVHRDAHMVRLGNKRPEYGFAVHKGYGTKGHYEALENHGISPYHRRSFLGKIIDEVNKK